MRKPQPFTIGTRLSTPKCPDFSTSDPRADGASKPRNTRGHISGHPPQDSLLSPPRGAAHSPDSDQLSPGSLVRSIRKIALSRQAEGAALREGTAAMTPRLLAKTSHGNCNNNNSRGLRHLPPDAADLPQGWTVRDPRLIIGVAECHRTAKCPGPTWDSVSDGVRNAPPTGSLGAGQSSRTILDIIQLSREIKQVESWVKCKLQEVTEGCDTSTLQRDLQSYEGTVLQLSQMVDQVSRAQPPSTASVCSQLQTLMDHWQMLKKMAAIQNCALGGATTLLEFNKMADELEMWMREKEEIPALHLLLDDDNLDKVQITRKILDLKQEQMHYCSLQENINSLAQKLEKLGRPESRAATTRRKHLNRMWLQLQTSLHEHHQTLHGALEAASLWHQSDNILRALEEKSHSAMVLSRDGGHGDQDLRDIASQIMMLDVTVSQVSKLHPMLSSRALYKHRQVKKRWAQLQRTLRTEKSSRTREEGDPLTSRPLEQSSVGNQEQSLLGNVVPVCQTEKTNSKNFAALSALTSPRRQSRSQVSGRHPTQAKRSVTSEPGTDHNPQNGHQPETPEVRHLLRELSSACQWSQGVEQLLSEPAAMRSPELIRKDLKHVSLLEREVRARGAALQGLRGNDRKLERTVPEEVKEKVQEVEERFQVLQDALRRRVSDLRDTLVLSEFMKVVQMEEERKKKETMTAPGNAHGDTDAPANDRSETFTPLEELQEAVEMLNDAVKERERALATTRDSSELESGVSALCQMMAAARAKLQDVKSYLEAAEKEFVIVKRETELTDLQGTVTQQQQVEADMSGMIGPEMRRLQGLDPSRSLSARRSLEDTLRTWMDLQDLMEENRARLQKTARLREFFLRYLGIISWTEVTRGQILSRSPRGRLSSAQREELERTMEGKLKEFEALAGIGWKLIGEDYMLARMIQERLEEVQGLLSWLLMRWRCQKRKRIMGNQTQKTGEDELKIALGSAALEEFECPDDEDVIPAPRGPTLRRYRRRALSPILFQAPSCRPPASTDMEEGLLLPEDGPRKCTKGPLWLEPKTLPTGSAIPEPQEEAVMPHSPHRSFWSRCQGVLEGTYRSLKRKKRISLPVVDEVSVYLNTKEETQGTYQSLTVPRVSKTVPSSGHNSLLSTSESSSGSLPKIRSNIFKSLRRKEKAERCTIQGIMGLYSDKKANTKDSTRYQTSTWPPKQEKNFTTSGTNMELETFLNYVKNPLSKDIDAQCGPGSKKPEPKSLKSILHTRPSSGPHLTVGSVLTLQISKERHILDNIQDTITVISADDSGNSQHLYSKEKPKPTADKMEVTEEPSSINGRDTQLAGTRTWLEALTSTSGYCRQNIHGYLKSVAYEQESHDLENFIENFEVDRLSPIVLRHLDPDWDTHEEALISPKKLEDASPNCNIADSQCQSEGATTTCPVLQETEIDSTNTSPVLQEGTTTSAAVFQETGEPITSSTVFRDTRGTTTSSTVLRKTRGATTAYPVLRDTEQGSTNTPTDIQETGQTRTSSLFLQATGGATTSSPILRETGGTFCVEKHSDNGQPASTFSSDCVLHTYEPSHHLHEHYSPTETSHDKGIFSKTNSPPEVLHPDHEFLENDDEELEGIWNNAKKAPLVCPAQASYNIIPKNVVGGSLSPVKPHRVPYGQVVMGAEPNMLVATFTLPASAMLGTESVTEKKPNTWKENSQSTAPVPTHCYPEEECEGRSMPSPQAPPPETVEKASMFKVTRSLDFRLMEGSLEKKHVLQVGGRKASSRTWGTFYAMLVRRTLCFYHDHKHPTRRSVSAPPLHLTGAVCTPESDYTKRDNCFRLRLMDGSEYLFRAPTPESLQQWVTKLRHNSGMEDTDLLRGAASDLSPRIISRSLMPDLCQSVPVPADSPYWKEAEKMTAGIPKHKSHHLLPESEGADPDSNVTTRRRSQSFSSVMYQKVMPVSAPQDSSFSVTLYLDDPLTPRMRCHSFAAPQGALLSRHAVDLRPRNKSVFRKFFRKKE